MVICKPQETQLCDYMIRPERVGKELEKWGYFQNFENKSDVVGDFSKYVRIAIRLSQC